MRVLLRQELIFNSGGAGGESAGIIASGTNSTINGVLLTAKFQGGNGGNSVSTSGSRSGGKSAGVIVKGDDSKISNVLITGNVRGGSGGVLSSAFGGNAAAGGESAGIIGSGTNTTINDILLAAEFQGGNGGANTLSDGASGAGGKSAGVIEKGDGSKISNVLITGNVRGGSAGSAGAFNVEGAEGESADIIASGTEVSSSNIFYNTETTGIPGGSTTAELQTPCTYADSDGFENWRKARRKYPFPEAMDSLYFQVQVNETVPLDCTEYACSPDQSVTPTPTISVTPTPTISVTPTPTISVTTSSTPTLCGNADCLFTAQTPGSIQHIVYDGQRFHGFVRAGNGQTYWTSYEKDASRTSLEPCCEVYSFTDLNNGQGVFVDAVAYGGEQLFYVAYHTAGRQDSTLARFRIGDDSQPEHEGFQPEHEGFQPEHEGSLVTIPRPEGLWVEAGFLYLRTHEQLYSVVDMTPTPLPFVPDQGENIHGAQSLDNLFYLLIEDPDNGWQVKAVDEVSGQPEPDFTPIPVNVLSGQTVVLNVANDRIHLLVQENSQIRWLTYNLQGEKQGESLIYIADSVTLSRLDLALESTPDAQVFRENVIAMGANSKNQPWWSAVSFEAVLPTVSTESGGVSTGLIAGVNIMLEVGLTVVTMATVCLAVGLYCYMKHRSRPHTGSSSTGAEIK